MPRILPKPQNQVTGEPSWRWRRAIIFAIIAFCAIQLSRLIDAGDTRLNETIASGLMWLLGVTSLGYAGLATAQDVSAIVMMRSGRPYADVPPAEPTPAPINVEGDATLNLTPPDSQQSS